jgi:single-stranded DNA-specific DHH superfamily exonuclease
MIDENLTEGIEAQEIDYGTIVRRSMDRINFKLADGIVPSFAISGLKAMMSPYFDEEFHEEFKALEQSIKDEVEHAKRLKLASGKSVQVTSREEINLELLGIITRLMHRKGLLLQEWTSETLE